MGAIAFSGKKCIFFQRDYFEEKKKSNLGYTAIMMTIVVQYFIYYKSVSHILPHLILATLCDKESRHSDGPYFILFLVLKIRKLRLCKHISIDP